MYEIDEVLFGQVEEPRFYISPIYLPEGIKLPRRAEKPPVYFLDPERTDVEIFSNFIYLRDRPFEGS